MMLFLRRVVGAVILILLFSFGFPGASAAPLHPHPGWLQAALARYVIVLLLMGAAGWLMMCEGGGAFARRIRICGMLLIANSQFHGGYFFPLQSAYRGVFGEIPETMAQLIILDSHMVIGMIGQPLAGLCLWLCGGLVDDDAERQWGGWRHIVRLTGIGLLVGAGLGLLVVGHVLLGPSHEMFFLEVMAREVFGIGVMGAIGAYLVAEAPWRGNRLNHQP